ncbi:MAG TPA: hypothetical protein VH110_07075 [Candidatus Acidoferrum sp.]|nr:hypothetical protein [Candidatus Acidoferrum sp.]
MEIRTRIRTLSRISLLLGLAVKSGLACGVVHAQEPPVPPPQSPAPPQRPLDVPFKEEAVKNAVAPCIEPPPMVRLEDYDGPLKKVVGTFARPLERKSVHPPNFKPDAKLCTLKLRDKFFLFVQDSLDPVTFLATGFEAGLDQAQNSDHSYGQGAKGYARRYGAEFTGQATSRFFGDFMYPWIFSEDPRYYRLAHGRAKERLFHAMEHVVVAHTDNGSRMLNFSEWLGTTSSVVLSNTYHPDSQRGVSRVALTVTYNVLQDIGFDILREFWPEISRKLRLPFRGQSASATPGSTPAAN